MDLELEKQLEKYIEYENLLYECTKESLSVAKNHELFQNKAYTQTLILNVSLTKPFEFKILGDLFADSLPVANKLEWSNIFTMYLYKRKLISKDDVIEEEEEIDEDNLDDLFQSEGIIEEGSIWDIVRSDDVQKFVSYIATTGTNILEEELFANMYSFSVFSFAAHFGAINIIKNLIMSGYKPNEYTLEIAFMSGTADVIEYLLSLDYKIEDFISISNAVYGHQNKLLEWLVESDDSSHLKEFSSFYNTEMILRFLKEGNQEIEKEDLDFMLEKAKTSNNIPLYKVLSNIAQKQSNKE